MTRHVAVVIFYDENQNIIVQKRNSIDGYQYGFWGGGIEGKETPEEAIRRELIEELEYSPDEIEYLCQHDFQKGETHIKLEIFLSPITAELLNSNIYEGDGMEKMQIDEAISGGFSKGDIELLKKLRQDFDKIKK